LIGDKSAALGDRACCGVMGTFYGSVKSNSHAAARDRLPAVGHALPSPAGPLTRSPAVRARNLHCDRLTELGGRMNGARSVVVFSSVLTVWLAIAHGTTVRGQTVPADPARGAQMRDHYSHALTLHAAVIRGDVPAIAAAAAALREYEGPQEVGPRSAFHVSAIREAAAKVAAATDVPSAAYAAALMPSACGNCHRAVGTMPAAPLAAPSEIGGVVGHMLAHQRAADQMLQGLIVPSDSLWRAGTRAFVSAPLHPRDLPVTSAERRQLAPTEERIHRLASEAAQATDMQARASYYGQMLSGCADCHKQHAKLWGPKPR